MSRCYACCQENCGYGTCGCSCHSEAPRAAAPKAKSKAKSAATKGGMRRFQLQRKQDVSGVSGTGIVAEGVEFANGFCAVTWLSPMQCVNVYANAKTVIAVHGHNGATELVWLDP